MKPDAAVDALRARGDPARAADMAAYHKAARAYLGVSVPVITDLATGWRRSMSVPERVELAGALWDSDIHEARVAATKLLLQARLRPDDLAWTLIRSWVPDFDAWAIADHAAAAGAKRLVADPVRLGAVEAWTRSEHMWSRRAALVMTLPWTKQDHPSSGDSVIRERILGWAGGYVGDPDWFIQKSVAWWLRELSKHDGPRVARFLEMHGAAMKPFARKEAGRYLGDPRFTRP